MRAIRVASAALLGISALTVTVCTTAAAQGSGYSDFNYNPEPNSIAPGERISLPVRGCDDATVYSGAFDNTVTIPRGRGAATATVGRDTRPGTTYDVTFQCGHRFGHRQLAMASAERYDHDEDWRGDDRREEGSRRSDRWEEGSRHSDRWEKGSRHSDRREEGSRRGEERPSYERHGVHAGVGGSIGGLDMKEIGLGSALVAGSLGTAWRLSRRRTAGSTS